MTTTTLETLPIGPDEFQKDDKFLGHAVLGTFVSASATRHGRPLWVVVFKDGPGDVLLDPQALYPIERKVPTPEYPVGTLVQVVKPTAIGHGRKLVRTSTGAWANLDAEGNTAYGDKSIAHFIAEGSFDLLYQPKED